MQVSVNTLSKAGQKPASKHPRPLGWIGGAVFLTLAGLALWQFLPNRAHQVVPALLPQTSQGRAVPVGLQTAAAAMTPQWLEVTGTVQAELGAPVGSKVMGRVQRVLVREGDRVRRGQPLILLDAKDLNAGVAEARANLRAAGVGYENSRVTARMEVSLSAARIAEARAKVSQSEAAMQAAASRLEFVQAGPRGHAAGAGGY